SGPILGRNLSACRAKYSRSVFSRSRCVASAAPSWSAPATSANTLSSICVPPLDQQVVQLLAKHRLYLPQSLGGLINRRLLRIDLPQQLHGFEPQPGFEPLVHLTHSHIPRRAKGCRHCRRRSPQSPRSQPRSYPARPSEHRDAVSTVSAATC